MVVMHLSFENCFNCIFDIFKLFFKLFGVLCNFLPSFFSVFKMTFLRLQQNTELLSLFSTQGLEVLVGIDPFYAFQPFFFDSAHHELFHEFLSPPANCLNEFFLHSENS